MNIENIIDNVLNYPVQVAILEKNEMNQCLDKVIPILKKEKALLELEGKLSFVGDTHGDFAWRLYR